jgi:hypothetical protein
MTYISYTIGDVTFYGIFHRKFIVKISKTVIAKINLFNPMKLQIAILLFEKGALALRVALQIKNVFIKLCNFLPG